MTQVSPLRFIDALATTIVGLRQRIAPGAKHEIGALWVRLGPLMETVKSRTDKTARGLVTMRPADGGPGFDYVAGVEVARAEVLAPGLIAVSLPALTYATFAHEGDVSNFRDTVDAAAHQWLPDSGYQHANEGIDPAGAPDLIEFYGEQFRPDIGRGDMQVWFPVKRRVEAG